MARVATNKPTRTWQEIAAEASKETDPEKLLALTAELERAFEKRDQSLEVPTEAFINETIARKQTIPDNNQ